MGNGGNGLHFNGVHLLKRVVEDSGGINSLESQVLVVEMTNKQTLGRESVRLNIDIRAGDAAQKAGLSDIGISANQESAGIRVNRGQTTQVLPDLFEVNEGIFQTAADGSHATETGALQLLALEQGLSIFNEADIVTGNGFDQVFSSRDLTEGNSEMIGIVEGVHQILV
jgi:hypothetical protein